MPEPTFPGKLFFDAVYRGRAPWDIGAPQPDLMDLIAEFPPSWRVLDLGCGTGDLAIGLAQRGYTVLGIDFAEAAIDTARERAAALPSEQRERVEFQVADAMKPSRWAGTIGAAVDSGFYHLFDSATRAELVHDLAAALPPAGRYYVLGFGIVIPYPEAPKQITSEEIRALFSREAGWEIKALRPASFHTVGFDEIPALALCAERLAGS